jgi:hypothetical protein
MEEVADRRDALTAEDLRRRRALGPQPDPSPAELAIDRAHGAVERQAPRSRLGRPEVFHVVGSTTRCVTFRRVGLIVGRALLAAACGSGGSSLFGARLPAGPEALGSPSPTTFRLVDGLHGNRRWSTSGTRVAALPQGAPLLASANPDPTATGFG